MNILFTNINNKDENIKNQCVLSIKLIINNEKIINKEIISTIYEYIMNIL